MTPGILCRPDPTRHRAAAATLEAAAASGRTLLRRWPTSAALLLPTPVNISVSAYGIGRPVSLRCGIKTAGFEPKRLKIEPRPRVSRNRFCDFLADPKFQPFLH